MAVMGLGHGPVVRKDIKDKSGVSAGAIANYLNAKHGFAIDLPGFGGSQYSDEFSCEGTS